MQDRIDELEARLASVEQRLRVLEGAKSGEVTYEGVAPEPTLGTGFVSSASTQIGRVLLIFGGAYLLRAITESEFVPTAIGILLGAIYAVFWMLMADRKGRIEQQRASAAFYGATSLLLALPLLVEAVIKFQLLSGRQGVLALATYSILALWVAVLRDLRSLAWLIAAGGIGAGTAVLIASHEAVSVATFLLLLGLGSLWGVYQRGWLGPQWLGAMGVNAAVLAMIVVSGSEQWTVRPGTAAIVALSVLVAYLGAFAWRTHMRMETVGMFEPAQALLAGGIGFGAVMVAARSGQLNLLPVGMASTALGGLAYFLALSGHARRERRKNYFYYSTLGLLLVFAGTGLMMPLGWAAFAWCLLAIVMAWFSGRLGWVTLSLQCTFLLLAAGISSGLLTTGLQALTGSIADPWPALSLAHTGIAMATVACLFIPVAQSSQRWGVLAGLPQLLVLGLAVWEVGGLIVLFAAPFLAGIGGAEPNAPILAALRTVVLSAASVTLALSSRYKRWPEARWLVYPVLILVAIKLFAEDFPNGQPATLFVALAFIGSALLLVARLLRSEDAEAQGL